MKATRFFAVVLVLTLLVTLAGAAGAQEPQQAGSGGCLAGAGYDPACDVNRDGNMTVVDLELVANHWGQTGDWTSDVWLTSGNPGTNPSTHFLGTTDGKDLVINPNGGDVGIGTTNPLDKLVIGDGVTSANVRIPKGGLCIDSDGACSSPGDGGLRVGSGGIHGTDSSNSNVYLVPNSGYVSIGTTNPPSAYLQVDASGSDRNGVYVETDEGAGMHIESEGWTGLYTHNSNTDASAISVASDGGDGVLVFGAGDDGIHVMSAGDDGVQIISSDDDGVQIGDGTDFPNYGVYTPNPGVPNTALLVQTAHTAGEWALRTSDKISAANVTLSSLTLVAMADGPDPLTPGDLVAASGLAEPLPDTLTNIPRVRPADGKTWTGVIGVVESRMVLQPLPGKEHQGDNPPLDLHSIPGPAKAGDYVAITVLGVAHLKADATDGAIVPGQRLTSADLPGHARILRSKLLDGMTVTEGAPVIGIALESLETGQDLIWVLVNPR